MSHLLLLLVRDGDAVIGPICDAAAAMKAGWKYGRPGFPPRSPILRRQSEEKSRLFMETAMHYAKAVAMVTGEAKLSGINIPNWHPAPPWLEAALEDVARNNITRSVASGCVSGDP